MGLIPRISPVVHPDPFVIATAMAPPSTAPRPSDASVIPAKRAAMASPMELHPTS